MQQTHPGGLGARCRSADIAHGLTVLLLLALMVPRQASAQVVEVAPFTVDQNGVRFVRDVAAGFDGAAAFLVTIVGDGISRYTPEGAPLSLTGISNGSGATMASRGSEGFVAVRLQGEMTGENQLALVVFGATLDLGGQVTSASFRASLEGSTAFSAPAVAALPDGWVVAWAEISASGFSLRTRRYSALAQPLESPVAVSAGVQDYLDVVGTQSGGYLVVWHEGSSTLGRGYAPNGQPYGDAVPVSTGFQQQVHVAASPLGGVAVVGLQLAEGSPATDVLLRLASDTAVPVGGDILLAAEADGATMPIVEADYAGHVFVAWIAGTGNDATLRARAVDAAGTPLSPAVTLAPAPGAYGLRSAALADGRFVLSWNRGLPDLPPEATVVSLCAPGSAVCGGGVLVSTCEQCDDGAGNSDTTPDACRTTCLLPRCGDAVLDGGEECDDGNFDACDGCSPGCRVEPGFVCGDGVASRACGEQCDDANAVPGDGCTATCTLERIPGGGPVNTDCAAEWLMDNAANVPLLDKSGAFNWKQVCVDDDPRCDFDGGTPGSCTFHVAVCGNNGDLAGCNGPLRLASWDLATPSASKASHVPALAQVRDAFAAAVPAAIVGPTLRDICSAPVAVAVPLRGTASKYRKATLNLKSVTSDYDGRRDTDKLKLVCAPAPS